MEYKVTIATGSTGLSVKKGTKGECVQCKLTGTLGDSLWINLFANFHRNTVDVFHFTGANVGELIETAIRLKGQVVY